MTHEPEFAFIGDDINGYTLVSFGTAKSIREAASKIGQLSVSDTKAFVIKAVLTAEEYEHIQDDIRGS